MADGRDESPAYGAKSAYPWTEIFRCFQVALDPRKLLTAAAGILVVSLGWYILSVIFNRDKPLETAAQYTDGNILQRAYPNLKPEEQTAAGRKAYEQDLAAWKLLNSLAGEGGRLRTLPWYEYRGPNPYLFMTTLLGGSSVERQEVTSKFLSSTVPVLLEPLIKLLIPIVKILDPTADFFTRLYLLLCVVWSLACWAFFAGVITRIAAVQLTGKDRITLKQAVQFVANRYLSYFLSPIVPLGIIAAVVIGLMIFGFLALIPLLGDIVFYGLGLPLVIAGGIVMAIILIGLVGYPLMYTTLSVEGSDTFDALSRAYNYVFQAPWQYIWYSLIAVVYGAAVTFFIVFVASTMVYLGKWSVSQAPLSETTNRKPDYLFIFAPESFGWKELLLKGSALELTTQTVELPDQRKIEQYVPVNPEQAQKYRNEYSWYNWLGTGLATFWLVIVFLLMLGFSYSFYWSAATMIYLLMRKKVDEVDLDEIYLEEEPETPYAPPSSSTPAASEKPGAASLPMVSPPAAPATVPFPSTPSAPPPPPPPSVATTPPTPAAPPPPPASPPASSAPKSTPNAPEKPEPKKSDDSKSDDEETK